MRLQSVSPGHLNGLYRQLEQTGLAPGTIRFVHAVISRALRDAERWGRVPRNVARMADPPREITSRVTVWTAGELRWFLDHVHEDRLAALWRLGATTGMRRGELAGLTWRTLDLDAARLSVEQQLVPTKGGATFGPPKSRRSRRTVALDPETVEALRRHRETQRLERAFAGPAYTDHDLDAEAWLPRRRGSTRRSATEEVAMSESTQERPDEADEKAPKPGEPDTETVAGQPKKAPESKDGEQQSKQDQ